MGLCLALEIFSVGNPFTCKRIPHCKRVEQQVAHQHTHGEDEDRAVWGQLAGSGCREIVQIHGSRHKPVEK